MRETTAMRYNTKLKRHIQLHARGRSEFKDAAPTYLLQKKKSKVNKQYILMLIFHAVTALRHVSHCFTSSNIPSQQCSFPRNMKYCTTVFALCFGSQIFFLDKKFFNGPKG
jgi:hypothetical protein